MRSGEDTLGALFGSSHDPRRHRQRWVQMFRRFLHAGLALVSLVALGMHPFLDDPLPLWSVDVALALLLLGGLATLRRQGPRAAAIVCLAGFWIIEVVVLFLSAGLVGPPLVFFPFIVVSAACFWSVRAAAGLAAATVLATACIGWAATEGWLPEPLFTTTAGREWAALVGCLGVTVVLANSAAQLLASLRRESDASEQRLSELIAESADGVISVDAAGRLLSCNRAAERLSGLAAVDVVGRPLCDLGLFAPDELRRIQAELAAIVDGETRAPLDLTLQAATGETLHVECISRSYRRDGGEVALLTTIRDVTQRKRSERRRSELERLLARSQRLDSIGRLAAGIAHDFNNLLTVIMASSELLLESADQDDRDEPCDWREDAASIRAAAVRAATLTNQLLTFGRRQPLAPEVLDLGTVVCEVSEMLSRLLGEAVELVIELQSGVGPVLVDRAQVEHLVVNLVLNARDAMPEGGTVTLGVSERRVPADASGGVPEGHWVMLSVSDTGVGMDPSTQAQVFDPFFSTKQVGAGTGLGLATVHGFVTQSGGHVLVDSAPGEGSRFDVLLPRIEGTPARAKRPRPAPQPKPEPSGLVLVVEDEQRVRQIVCRILESAGYTVVEAGDGEQGLELLAARAGSFELLISDVIMPGIGGPELARRARRLAPGLAVLFVSGYAGKELGAQGDPEEQGDLLRKPFAAEELLAAVARARGPSTTARP